MDMQINQPGADDQSFDVPSFDLGGRFGPAFLPTAAILPSMMSRSAGALRRFAGSITAAGQKQRVQCGTEYTLVN